MYGSTWWHDAGVAAWIFPSMVERWDHLGELRVNAEQQAQLPQTGADVEVQLPPLYSALACFWYFPARKTFHSCAGQFRDPPSWSQTPLGVASLVASVLGLLISSHGPRVESPCWVLLLKAVWFSAQIHRSLGLCLHFPLGMTASMQSPSDHGWTLPICLQDQGLERRGLLPGLLYLDKPSFC